MELLSFLLAYAVFVLAFSFPSMTVVVYIVAFIYMGSEVFYKMVMSIVPRVWKCLMVTFLWFFLIVFAYSMDFRFVYFLFIFTSVVRKMDSMVFHFGLIVITLVFIYGYVYINMVWNLACVISVLEDKYNLGAM